jgi:hypothetical protein
MRSASSRVTVPPIRSKISHALSYFGCASAAGRRNMFLDTFDSTLDDATSSRNDAKTTRCAIPRQRLGLPRSRVRRRSAMCRSCRSSLVLVRIEATPPQRVIECIDWTPSCSPRNILTNHVSVRPLPAFPPGSSFTVLDHLQLAPRNT